MLIFNTRVSFKSTFIILAIISLSGLSVLSYYHACTPVSEQNSEHIFDKIRHSVEKAMNSRNPSDIRDRLNGIRSDYSIRSIRIIGNSGKVLTTSGRTESETDFATTEQLAAGLRGQGVLQVLSQKGPSVAACPIRNGASCRRCHNSAGQTLGIISLTFDPVGKGLLSGRYGLLYVPFVTAGVFLSFVFCYLYPRSSWKRFDFEDAESISNREAGNDNMGNRTGHSTGPRPRYERFPPGKKWTKPAYLARRLSWIRNREKHIWSCRSEPGQIGGPGNAAVPRKVKFEGGKIPVDIFIDRLNGKYLNFAKTLQRLSAVHKVALATNSNMELDKVLSNLLDVTMKALNSEIAYILLYNGDSNTFQVHTLLDQSGNPAKIQEMLLSPDSVSTWVYNSRKPVLIRNIEDAPEFGRRSLLGHERKSLVCVPLIVRDEIIGAMSVVNKMDDSMYTSEDLELLTTIASQASFALKNAKMYEEQQKIYMNIIHALVSIIDASDSYTRGHSERVTIYSLELAKKINLPRERIDIVERAAILHDIGKIGINASLLNKGKILSSKEVLKLREHPLTGMRILEPLDFLGDVCICVGQHHERFDGTGYPFGIPGDKLLVESRILAIADAFDAMTSNRPYRKALSPEKAMGEITDNAGRQHDPFFVRHFVELIEAGTFDHLVSHDGVAYLPLRNFPEFSYGSGISF